MQIVQVERALRGAPHRAAAEAGRRGEGEGDARIRATAGSRKERGGRAAGSSEQKEVLEVQRGRTTVWPAEL
jgi:hypothetical protein